MRGLKEDGVEVVPKSQNAMHTEGSAPVNRVLKRALKMEKLEEGEPGSGRVKVGVCDREGDALLAIFGVETRIAGLCESE